MVTVDLTAPMATETLYFCAICLNKIFQVIVLQLKRSEFKHEYEMQIINQQKFDTSEFNCSAPSLRQFPRCCTHFQFASPSQIAPEKGEKQKPRFRSSTGSRECTWARNYFCNGSLQFQENNRGPHGKGLLFTVFSEIQLGVCCF